MFSVFTYAVVCNYLFFMAARALGGEEGRVTPNGHRVSLEMFKLWYQATVMVVQSCKYTKPRDCTLFWYVNYNLAKLVLFLIAMVSTSWYREPSKQKAPHTYV